VTRLVTGRPAASVALVAGAVVFGVAVRIWVHVSSLGTLDADEAVWGLMARHAFDGGLSAFYWGQGYGGTAEVVLTAPLVAAFGYSTTAIRLVPAVLNGVAAIVVWRVGRRTIGEPAATAAGLLTWVWPPYLIWKSVRAHGFYASGLVVVALVLLLVLRLAEEPRRRDTVLLGLTLGIGWWLTPQTMVIGIPALAWLTWRRPGVWRHAWAAAPAFVFGALPWLLSNVRHDWWSLRPDVPPTSYLERVRGFFSATFPMELGARIPFSSEWLGGPVFGAALYLAALALLGWVGWRSRRAPLGVAALCVAVFPFLHAVSPYAWVTDEPRYVVLLTPALALLLARPLRGVGAALALTGAAALSVGVLVSIDRSPEYEQRADGLFVPHDVGSLVAQLERRGIDRLYAHYWVAYLIDFESGERVIAAEAPLDTVRRRGALVLPDRPIERTDLRHVPYDTLVRRLGTPPYVTIRGTPDDAYLRAVLGRAGYAMVPVGGFVLYVPRVG
jgi:4-amino-4-deoxy-L-arabinose transferase-like glycosyltransferase